MNQKISVSTAEHYTWGNKCDAWHFLKSEDLSVIKEKMPPGTSEKMHYHTKSEQFFFVLSGTASFEIGNDAILVEPNEGIQVTPGLNHKISNQAKTDLEFIVISRPPSHGDRIDID